MSTEMSTLETTIEEETTTTTPPTIVTTNVELERKIIVQGMCCITSGIVFLILSIAMLLIAIKLWKGSSVEEEKTETRSEPETPNEQRLSFQPWAHEYRLQTMELVVPAEEHVRTRNELLAEEEKYFADAHKKYGDDLENGKVVRAADNKELRLQHRYSTNYGHSTRRVKLKSNPQQYYNAHWGNESHSLIIAQAPFAKQKKSISTTASFLTMLCDNDVCGILAIGEAVEGSQTKFFDYVPPVSESIKVDAITVTTNSISTLTDSVKLVELTILVEGKEPKSIFQLHHKSWADHSAPQLNEMANIHAVVKELFKRNVSPSTPLIVHCTSGINRSATYALMIEMAFTMVRSEKKVSPKEIWLYMRQSRRDTISKAILYVAAHLYILYLFKAENRGDAGLSAAYKNAENAYRAMLVSRPSNIVKIKPPRPLPNDEINAILPSPIASLSDVCTHED